MNRIAIIPARSGSKGLPGKNIKKLNGKPLIAYTIEAAKNSNEFDEIIVSTDSQEYANISKSFGANVPFLRDNSLATDKSPTWDAVKEVLTWFQEKRNINFSTVCVLQPTSPLRDSHDIIKAFSVFKVKQAKSVVSVSEVDYNPNLTNILPDNHSLNGFISTDNEKKRRQELEEYYRLNGAIYIRRAEEILKDDPIYTEETYAYIMSKENSIDIDDYIDFLFAEVVMKYKEGSNCDK
ncbi:acylneuraminate cytidylyltransferase [Gracilibacillus halophilus YIM-C55.5]|uniref:Acylneuraminate cytidylyltransferase n=1 Tax=Gracilibacillus halophilus YIM-C55.5 TaxID=1308866 RepID=N4WUV8_9BACI|nr:acylneuraminate cytidylyltransferase family protein [Gracilibacillus halophilus]ENH98115.1 acylneuraminate cytidylyltransferase [Gracilibacillus halophilus YIM-C55.5]